jgi:hypothetical protein
MVRSPFLSSSLDASQRAMLQRLYEEICCELGIDPGKPINSELPVIRACAAALLSAAIAGERNPVILKAHAIFEAARAGLTRGAP